MEEYLASAAEKRVECNPVLTDVEECGEPNKNLPEPSNETQSSVKSENSFPQMADLTAPPVFVDESHGTSSSLEEDKELNRWPTCAATLPPLTPSKNHTILFRPHLHDGSAPQPYPDEYIDRWDVDHVRMPCSPLNQYSVEISDGKNIVQNRWDVICSSLSKRITSSTDLENAIMQYNSQYSSRWNFIGLHVFLNEILTAEQRTLFFDTTLPAMIKLALQLPQICTQPIPLLKKYTEHSITMSQKQISCLLANAFFCTFPGRNFASKWHGNRRDSENADYFTYPDINFDLLFYGYTSSIKPCKAEKLKCLLNYFSRVTTEEPTGTVTFHRKHLQVFPNWVSSNATLKKTVIVSDGAIETAHGMLQVDFANECVGGLVLAEECLQEDIRFIICTELIASMLFTEQLADSEALVVTGAEQYNKHSGYANYFKWDCDYQDQSARDAWGRKYVQVVAIDAVPFCNSTDQFKVPLIERELNKAFVGFCDIVPHQNLPAVATGNWGCGAFGGDPKLKFLIQIMAASQAGRGLLYFTFDDRELQRTLQNMYKFLCQKKLTIGQIWELLHDYYADVIEPYKKCKPEIYHYIYNIKFPNAVQRYCAVM